MSAKLIYRYGVMGASKSLALISVFHNYRHIGKTAKVYTAALDNRFGLGVVASRAGSNVPAELFNADTEFTVDSVGEGVAAILVDECQFLNARQVGELSRIAALHGIPVMAYGLRSDFQGKAFEGSAALTIIADRMEEIPTICGCGRRANFTMRLDAAGNRVREGGQILIGDAQYVAACSTCFYS